MDMPILAEFDTEWLREMFCVPYAQGAVGFRACYWGTECLIHVSMSWICVMKLSPLTHQKLLCSNSLGLGNQTGNKVMRRPPPLEKSWRTGFLILNSNFILFLFPNPVVHFFHLNNIWFPTLSAHFLISSQCNIRAEDVATHARWFHSTIHPSFKYQALKTCLQSLQSLNLFSPLESH